MDLVQSCLPTRAARWVGLPVVIVCLTEHLEMNGRRGTVVHYCAERQRWLVRVDDNSLKLLRGRNLVLGGPKTASSEDATSHAQDGPELISDKVPTSCASSDQRFDARGLSDVSVPCVADGLFQGSTAVVSGVSARPDFLGQRVLLLEFVEEESLWRVQMEDGVRRHFRAVHLEPSTEEMRDAMKLHASESTFSVAE
mmetsp:Transcript_28038/g.74056  ORF Transcript_28038/g.74056 Transcript_28038/m.74056 type:complete len:197 (-) Transcript_28038:86-676(-)|eukprot:CAMPEP_0194541738 /NCGR_PEP_ID=MMETSP0253-20130528/82730_1 /TAXON_ID=2966 /ORGANISM="Noctiluca scintillans" /LENGTH=196 /DNA_ID=CAMNT_0039388263 /DNA_START=125 /DNA_END=715 /DNA_ORIENTATION=+